MQYMFLANIGPIQGFIASARRTGDLQFGSWLLSELAKAAAKSIADKSKLESLIFPAPQSIADLAENTPLSVANKIVALIDDPPQDVGDAVRKAINIRLHNIKKQAYEEMGPIDDVIANKQIDDLVEYFWVAAPYNAQDYGAVRTKLEEAMAARKNTRDFQKVDWGSNKPKSSIDGQLEGVIPDKKYNQHGDSKDEQKKKAEALYERYKAGPAERLSGVDLLKRRGRSIVDGSPMESFPSTSHMAAIPYLERIKQIPTASLPQIQKKWDEYIKALKEIAISQKLEQVPHTFLPHVILGRYEGSLLFEERLVEMVDVPSLLPDGKAKFQEVKQKLRNFYQAVATVFETAPLSPYYAILLADGDYMGKVIDNQQYAKEHREISQALDTFSRGVQDIVKKYLGALIYAGGDDVLALVPLHTAIACAHELSESFYNELQKKNFHDKDGNKPTLSAGIVIVHHLDALQDSLTLARAAEQKAKGVKGKDALAITVSKRGGVDYTVSGQWGKTYTFLEDLTKQCADDNIPDGTAYEWENLLQRLAFSDPAHEVTRRKALQAEAVRILQRKVAPLSENDKKAVMDLFAPKLGFTYVKQGQTWKVTIDSQQAEQVKLDELTNQLLLAQLLADAQRLVHPKPKQGATA